MIKTVSGIRGQIKKSVREGGEGCYRATFEDKIIKSDLVFLRTWFKMPLQKFYNPIVSFERMRLMKTTWELRKERSIQLEQNKDSLYKEIERPDKKFKEGIISKNLQAALPFKTQEKVKSMSRKEKLAKKEEALPIKSLTSDKEKQAFALIQRLNTIRNEKEKIKQAKKEEKNKIKTAQKEGLMRKFQPERKEKEKQRNRARFGKKKVKGGNEEEEEDEQQPLNNQEQQQQQQQEKKQKIIKQEKKQKTQTFGPIKIFYGSQSGTATKFAGILQDEALENDFQPEILSVETYEQSIIPNKEQVCIFLMATHGEGEPTDNAIDFYKWIKGPDRDEFHLNNMKYTVFGLGNKQYEHYNSMGRNTNKFLKKCGAQIIYQYGEGDDNFSLEDDFNDWKENLWAELKKVLPQKQIQEEEEETKKNNENENNEIIQKIEKNESEKKSILQAINLNEAEIQPNLKYDFQTEKFLKSAQAKVINIFETRQINKEGSTLHLELDLTGTEIEYKTAQNLGIFVKNDEKMVAEIAKYLNFDLKQVIPNPQNAKNVLFPGPLSVENVLTYFCDFQGQLMKKTLKDLAKLCENEENKNRLEFLASAKGKSEFKTEIEENKLTIFDLMQKYQVKPTLDQFLIMTPRLAPRVFTISSSNLQYKNAVHVTDSILVDNLPNGKTKTGVCSQYFQKIYEQFQNGEKDIQVRIDFRESSFKLPQDQTPVIMVGAGTGVAPFRAFCQEKQYLIEKGINLSPGTFYLYFGCRHENGDFIFKDEFKNYTEKNIINKFYTAFSRDQEQKVYVQDRFLENADENYTLLFEKNATLFICGSLGMGKSIVNTVAQIISQKQNISPEEGLKIVKKLEDEKKIIKELW
ncbi:Riboflavin synthase-like beta-barrel [Pseudocohnilembus persalinus]|uniref:NADPH--hemoprotein reductase n=1 Tax=Pseudocohnilembus persalinus TaxID=266149 RepID=A0A0V0R842_PSEPJ|nr:Riboflavin synthase-like beta-barrel [Pseudocohnilembus persalinus]|eukprot:KRX10660.1 Riboflavin synthase-like beta-barrel [Pseudocohnilembus persalinus]